MLKLNDEEGNKYLMEYGVFNDFWDGTPNHLPFLNLHIKDMNSSGWGLPKSLDLISGILRKSSDSEIIEGIISLLKQKNWRCHLVAIFAILYSSNEIKYVTIEEI